MRSLLFVLCFGVALVGARICMGRAQADPISESSQSAENSVQQATPTAESIAQALQLESHIEGGYFRRTYQADQRPPLITEGGERYLLTSIYYMLTRQAPIGHWHLNKSDIVHYFHLGDPLRYSLIHADGRLEHITLGADIAQGQHLQLIVKGGTWKATELLPGPMGYGLISEAVSPGFDYEDMTIGTAEQLSTQFPQHKTVIRAYSKP